MLDDSPDDTDFRIAFCVSGRGRLFREAAVHFSGEGSHIAGVVLDDGADPALEGFCDERGIAWTHVPGGARHEADLGAALDRARPDLVCLTYDRIVPAAVVRRHRMINVHLSLLPAFKGFGALDGAVSSGARFSGATIHEVTEDVDGGATLAQCVVALERDETPESLGARIYALLRPMLLQAIAWHVEGRVARSEDGRVWIDGARYGELPFSPALEREF